MATSTKTTKQSVAQAINPIPEWMVAPVKAVGDVVTSAASTSVRIALNIEAMIPLSEETVTTVLEGRKVIEMLHNQ